MLFHFICEYSFQWVTQPGSASQKYCAFLRQNYPSWFYFGNGFSPSIFWSGFSIRIRLSFVLFKNMLDENKHDSVQTTCLVIISMILGERGMEFLKVHCISLLCLVLEWKRKKTSWNCLMCLCFVNMLSCLWSRVKEEKEILKSESLKENVVSSQWRRKNFSTKIIYSYIKNKISWPVVVVVVVAQLVQHFIGILFTVQKFWPIFIIE